MNRIAGIAMQRFLSIADATREDLARIFDLAYALRDQRQRGMRAEPVMTDKTAAMIFEKPSLRTRVSFEQAIFELGGRVITLTAAEVGLGKRESTADVARVLGGMVDLIIARVFEHQKLIDLAEHSGLPVINALSDATHPCQALADAMTMMDEFGRDLSGRTVAFIGDGNNVAVSLAALTARLGMRFIIASPEGFELQDAALADVLREARNFECLRLRDPRQAVAGADVIYTDTWVSMGQEAEKARREAAFADYQVNAALLAAAPQHAIVLHCLPAYRGVEITSDVLDGPRSRAFRQAHNRLHAQKGLLAMMMPGGRSQR